MWRNLSNKIVYLKKKSYYMNFEHKKSYMYVRKITAEELVDVGHDVSKDEVILFRVEPAQLSDPTVQSNQALDRYNR